MKGEIDKDFYCSACNNLPLSCLTGSGCLLGGYDTSICKNRHRKYPTPEQYRAEYGEDWAGAIYAQCIKADCDIDPEDCPFFKNWWVCDMEDGSFGYCKDKIIIICACAPWKKPPADWRPE